MENHMNPKNLRYIVFLLNPGMQYNCDGSKINCHDGFIFRSAEEARQYAREAIADKECTRFIIGSFVWDPLDSMMMIHCVETYGFKGDRKPITQLSLFSKSQNP